MEEEKSIKELAAMSRDELYAEAVIMRGRIAALRKKVAWLNGWVEMHERPQETADH